MPATEITAGEAVRATMGRCLTATPTPSSPTSIRPSARPSRSRRGPLCILAGAGSGKTRVISRRVAYALATGVVRPRDVLVVTFTDKAAGEMRGRLAALGHPGVRGLDVPCRRAPPAPPFLAARPRQRPAVDPRIEGADPRPAGGRACPAATGSSQVRDLAARDRVGEGAPDPLRPSTRSRAIADDRDALAAARPDGGPLPPVRDRQGARRPDRLRGHARADDRADRDRRRRSPAEVRDRYRWFSVDEYQDTNPLQAALLDAWLGGREDLAVVGDEDQTIYTFTGATSDYLIGFADALPDARGSCRLETNYRSTPEVLALANRVLAAGRTAPDERPPGRRAAAAEAPRRRACPPGPSPRSAASRPTRPSWPG